MLAVASCDVSSAKVRKTLTLDSALVDDDAELSSTINTILRDEVERRQALSGWPCRVRAIGGHVCDKVRLVGRP
jgi:hypothetical protein